MAGGPPTSIDIGSGSSVSGGPPSSINVKGSYPYDGSSSSSSYWEQGFGEGSGDPSDFIPSYTQTDKGIALFRLAVGSCFLVLGTYALVRFYRSRWILDIRTRSAHLVMVSGVSVLLTMLLSINGAVNIVWDTGFGWFWSSLLIFFITPALFGSYISRALRLAVVFHPKAKRAVPWLIPERNHIGVVLVVSAAMLAIPIYHEFTLEIWEIVPKQGAILSWMAVVFAVVLSCIFPFIRNVDDLFNISTELIIATAAIILLTVGLPVVEKWGGEHGRRWIGQDNLFLFFSAVLFGVSVVDPLRRLAFDPLAATKRNYADRVLLSRRESRSTRTSSGVNDSEDEDGEAEARLKEGGTGRTRGEDVLETPPAGNSGRGYDAAAGGNAPGAAHAATVIVPWAWVGTATSATVSANDGSTVSNDASNRNGRGVALRNVSRPEREKGGGRADREVMEVWDFERLARTPLLAAAFEDFSRKALCHESVLFLVEVSRYEAGDYATPSASTGLSPSQFDSFRYITETFIKAGSMEEVNISDVDKKRIIDVFQKGERAFEGIHVEERRMVFGRAYQEVKAMLEANLLRRFLHTDRFKNARMQRENVQTMMDSPPMMDTGVSAA